MILIPNMEMPTRCWGCPLSGGYEIARGSEVVLSAVNCRLTRKLMKRADERPSDCPLIELPPHGRLIEDTALDNMSMWNTNREYDRGWDSAVQAAKNRIKSAPTIIESEE